MEAVNNVPPRQYDSGIPAIKTISPSMAIKTAKRESGFLKHCTVNSHFLLKKVLEKGKCDTPISVKSIKDVLR